MIAIRFDHNNMMVEASGDPTELAAELSMAVGDIHRTISKRDAATARLFRSAMQICMSDDSPVWDTHPGEKTGVVRGRNDPVTPEDIARMIRMGATPEQIAAFCGGKA